MAPMSALRVLFAWRVLLVGGTRILTSDDASMGPLDKVLAVANMKMPKGLDPVQFSGHYPALEVFKTPDERVRVEGMNVAPGDSLRASTNDEYSHLALVYAVDSRTTAVELKVPDFFLPGDERTMEVWHQGELIHTCEVPSDETCMYTFDYKTDVGKRFVVRALSTHDRSILQEERVYTPYPYMCAASLFTRPDISVMDCSKLDTFPSPAVSGFSKTSKRGFAIELEFLAKNSSLNDAIGGEEALETVEKCATQKVIGTDFAKLAEIWNWEIEPSMVPFGPRDKVHPREYVGLMAELTSPGPPNVLVGEEGMADVARVFHTVTQMGTQVGLWAQLHVHVNVRSAKANPESTCCMTSAEVANIWTAWSKYQMVIDEMQNPTNVDNIWAKPLYMEDLIAREVFSNMHDHLDVDIDKACATFYGETNCDSKDHSTWIPPNAEDGEHGFYYHGPNRYSAVNLAPLPTKGTLEIRQQAGTIDAERAQRWIQFVLAFVETFMTGEGTKEFFDESVDKDVEDLKEAQKMASFDSLFDALGERVDPSSRAYFKERQWQRGSMRCSFSNDV